MLLSARPDSQTISHAQLPAQYQFLGGRALIACYLLDKSNPVADPFSSENTLIFAPGLLTGFRLPSMDRISIGGKSPLTLGIKESNAGGLTAAYLADLEIRALIIEGNPGKEWMVLHLSEQGAHFDSAEDLKGQGAYETARILHKRYGTHCAAALIGPAGERQYLAAGIQNIDKDGIPSRISARGGLGAVMGSKKIKAVVIDNTGSKPAEPADQRSLKELRKIYVSNLLENSFVQTLNSYGTAANTMICNHLGALPTHNFSEGSFDCAENISGETLFELIQNRAGKNSHGCMPGCVIRCSNQLPDEQGEDLISPLEYETIGLLGSNLGIGDLDIIAQANWELNDLGLDSIEIGAALGVAAEAELWSFGNTKKFISLIEEIRSDSDLGRLLASGASRTAEALGVERVPAVKRQAMPSYDPRVLKVTGVTYATSSQGADHTAGMTLRSASPDQSNQDLVEQSKTLQIKNAGLDALGACLFAGSALSSSNMVPDLLRACIGQKVDPEILKILGKKTLLWEREYNTRAGFNAQDDRIPAWMQSTPLPPTDNVFDIPPRDLDALFQKLQANNGE